MEMENKIEEMSVKEMSVKEVSIKDINMEKVNAQDILDEALSQFNGEINKKSPEKINKEENRKEIPSLEKIKCGKFTALILSAGSIKGIKCLGCLNYLYEKSYHTNITKYVGTSVGAIISYLLAISYTPLEILINLCKNKVFSEDNNTFNIQNILTDKGICDYSVIQKQLELMTIEKIGKFITINDLYTKYGKFLTVCTYNYDKKCMEYISPRNKGDTPCLIALRESSNLPIIFDKFKYDGSYYIDGAMGNYFPIDVPENICNINSRDEVIAIDMMIDSIEKEVNSKSKVESPIVYIYNLFFIPIRELSRVRKENKDKFNHINILELSHEDDNDSFFTYNVDIVRQLDMFSSGFKQMKAYIENEYFDLD